MMAAVLFTNLALRAQLQPRSTLSTGHHACALRSERGYGVRDVPQAVPTHVRDGHARSHARRVRAGPRIKVKPSALASFPTSGRHARRSFAKTGRTRRFPLPRGWHAMIDPRAFTKEGPAVRDPEYRQQAQRDARAVRAAHVCLSYARVSGAGEGDVGGVLPRVVPQDRRENGVPVLHALIAHDANIRNGAVASTPERHVDAMVCVTRVDSLKAPRRVTPACGVACGRGESADAAARTSDF